LEEVELWVFVENMFTVSMNLSQLVYYKKKEAKAKQIILDSVKDYIISRIAKKKTAKMYDALIELY
jgi:hypothetical protein